MARGHKITGWRKLASSAWGHPNDPQIFGDLEFDATAVLSFIEEARDAHGVRLTVTHVVGRALAHAFGEHPDLNVHLYRGRFIPRPSIDIFFIVSTDEGSELSGVKVADADKKSAVEVAEELSSRSNRIRSGEDVEFGKTKTMIGRIPYRLLRLGFKISTWITTDKGKDLKQYGLPAYAFGTAMVTSVGMFGIQHAYAPIAFYYRIPLLVLVGEVTRKPVAIGDNIEIRPMLNLAATLDHRYLDGYHAARLARSVREYLDDPKRFEPGLG
ncbi:MAG: 2-oxo acid dehydrogenase [Actinobacteria bacterium]|nr:2-oxo acid dehydrogenase [Actinomycetota bacterium]